MCLDELGFIFDECHATVWYWAFDRWRLSVCWSGGSWSGIAGYVMSRHTKSDMGLMLLKISFS